MKHSHQVSPSRLDSPPSQPASGTQTPKNTDTDESYLSSPKDNVFPETIPEEASSVEEEREVIFRLPATLADDSFYTADASLLLQQKPLRADGRPDQRSHFTFDPDGVLGPSDTTADAHQSKMSSSTEKDSEHNGSIHVGADDDGTANVADDTAAAKVDLFAATFLDVAVLRCLFVEHWQEDGVYWCLHYMNNR